MGHTTVLLQYPLVFSWMCNSVVWRWMLTFCLHGNGHCVFGCCCCIVGYFSLSSGIPSFSTTGNNTRRPISKHILENIPDSFFFLQSGWQRGRFKICIQFWGKHTVIIIICDFFFFDVCTYLRGPHVIRFLMLSNKPFLNSTFLTEHQHDSLSFGA